VTLYLRPQLKHTRSPHSRSHRPLQQPKFLPGCYFKFSMKCFFSATDSHLSSCCDHDLWIWSRRGEGTSAY